MPSKIIQSQFFYDGEKLTMPINIGDIEYFNSDTQSKEKFEAYKIDIKLPSEHLITVDGLTKRTVLEMQIYHKLISREYVLINHNTSPLNVKEVITSILFLNQDSKFDERFFQEMGITNSNKNKDGDLNIPKQGEMLKDILISPAKFSSGFDYLAFEGLMNLIGVNREMYFYYGSKTTSQCDDNVIWMVYKEPRAISNSQFNFLSKMIVKKNKEGQYAGNNILIKVN
jgi:hypothetical protein